MKWNDLKYLLAFSTAIAGFLGIYFGGWMAPGSIYIGFVLIPLYELFFRPNPGDMEVGDEEERSRLGFFDFLLYINLPIMLGMIFYALHTATTQQLSTWDLSWMVANVGLVVSASGINVAHELGHRQNKFEVALARALLLPALYMHFNIEHNHGHHKYVATPEDPATSRKNEWVYTFWFRSMIMGWVNAWSIESKRLKATQQPIWSPIHNVMLRFQLTQLAYMAVVYAFFGSLGLWLVIGFGLFAIIQLESVNYIEHYGLLRKKIGNRYEPVQPYHSWNSNHDLGRIVLYELTRHSDHHFKATRKFQILRSWEEGPQLPTGYPGMILLSLVPPLWFAVMNKRVEAIALKSAS